MNTGQFCVFFYIIFCFQRNLLASEDLHYSVEDTSRFHDISVIEHKNRERRQSPTDSDTAENRTTTPSTASEVNVVKDDHRYYTSHIYKHPDIGQRAWPELDTGLTAVKSGHRIASIGHPLPFKFPFYGHMVENVTIATGGYLYMSSFIHQWLTDTQYIAPLMANFDVTINDYSSAIYKKSFENIFAVVWRNVHLQDQAEIGPFHIQLFLFRNGTIAFVYKKLPALPSNISSANHQVKIGVSDAFYWDTATTTKRRTIYKYHQVAIDPSMLDEGSVVILSPLPTCNLATDCETCISQNTTFDCKWCGTVARCSDGVDRQRQEWMNNNCSRLAVNDTCPQKPTTWPSTGPNATLVYTNATKPAQPSNTTECDEAGSGNCSQSQTILSPAGKTTTASNVANDTPVYEVSTSKLTQLPVTTECDPAVSVKCSPKPTTEALISTTQTCNLVTDCEACISLNSTFNCQWCETIERCSDGSDRHREEWLNNNCSRLAASVKCSPKPTSEAQISKPHETSSAVVVTIVVVVLVVVLLGVVAGWFCYARSHPESTAGRWLMQHRPTQIKFWRKRLPEQKYALQPTDF